MASVWHVAQGHFVIRLEHINVQWGYGYKAENKRQQNPPAAFCQQLPPGSFVNGKIYPHPGHKEEEGNPPDIEERHQLPQGIHGFLTFDKADKQGPGLEYNGDVVDQQQADGDHPEPVDVVSSLCCHGYRFSKVLTVASLR